MKKTFRKVMGMLMVAVLATTLASCNNEDDEFDFTQFQKDIVGTWVNSTETTNTTYIIDENGKGTAQQVVYKGNNDSDVLDFNFTYTLMSNESGAVIMTITPAGGQTVNFPAKLENGNLVLGNDVFMPADKLKEIVGEWTMSALYEDGTPNENQTTITYKFDKDGKGEFHMEELYTETGVNEKTDIEFTWRLTAVNAYGFQVLVTVDNEDGTVTSFNVTINGKELTLDGDKLTKK